MRILWASNAPWAPSGYGGQTLQVVKRLAEAGHEVAIAANFGLQARMLIDDGLLPGVPVLPALYDGVGNDILGAHYMFWARGKPCELITLYDVWPYDRQNFRDIPISSWTPIDHKPVPPRVAEWAKEHRTIAMSRFGQEQLTAVGIESTYIPHAIEKTFSPVPDARETLGWERDAFYVVINAANKGQTPIRKAWPEMFQAMKSFMDAHDDVRLRLHTERVGPQAPDLGFILASLGLDEKRIDWSSQYHLKTGQIEQSDVATIYSAAASDGGGVLLATSKGEGFGIPVVEAQACGLPVIVSNWSAQPELVGGGWLAGVQGDWDPAQLAWFCTPIIVSIRHALEQAYEERASPEVRAAAIAKAAEYDADKVFAEGWVPYLAGLEAKPPRRERRKRKKAA